jgi:hypothetical protein
MMDRPGKKMAEYAVKKVLAEAMQNEAPDALARAAIADRAAKAGREAEAEVKREMRGKTMATGGKVSSASARADGCAQRGKTRGKMV